MIYETQKAYSDGITDVCQLFDDNGHLEHIIDN